MKKIRLSLLLLASMLFLTGCPDKPRSITKEEADNIVMIYVKDEIEPHSDEIYAVYYFNRLDLTHFEISFWGNEDKIKVNNAFVYFIDELVMANWGHPCRFLIVDKNTGRFTVFNRNSPPLTEFDIEIPWTLLFQKDRMQ